MSAYQVTFSIGDIVVPVVVTAALKAGAAVLWLPMAALALADLAAVAFLAPHMATLTRRVGEPRPGSGRKDRLLEADGL